jgi:excisionase family DNA binding protein
MTSSAGSAGSAEPKQPDTHGQPNRRSGHTAPSIRHRAKGNIVSNRDPKLTVAEICDELNVAKSTFYDWRTKGRAPRCIRLPNGDLRIRRSELDRWIDAREDAA